MEEEKKVMINLSKRNLVILLAVVAIGIISFSLFKGGPTGFVVKTSEEKAAEKLQIELGKLETATFTDYDFDEKGWLNKEYYRVWVKVFNPSDEIKVIDSIRLIDNSGNQYDPYETIAYRIDEQVFGSYKEVSAHTIREGYIAFPKLDTGNLRLVFVADGNTNAFQLR